MVKAWTNGIDMDSWYRHRLMVYQAIKIWLGTQFSRPTPELGPQSQNWAINSQKK